MSHLTINFKLKSLNMPVMLDVLMPQGHGGYKTLYLLHGAGGDHACWTLKTRIADYVEGKDIAVVMPSGNNRFYVNNVNGKDYFSFIADELINNCETWFNISRNPEDRYIAGMSMGGYGAFYAALKRPKQYNTAFSYSGLLNLIERYDNPQGIDMYPVFGTREELIDNNFDLYSLFNKKGTDDSKIVDNPTKFIIACGLQDPRLHMSKDFYKEAKEAGLNVSMYEQDGGHEWDYWDKCIEQTIKCIAGEDSKWQ